MEPYIKCSVLILPILCYVRFFNVKSRLSRYSSYGSMFTLCFWCGLHKWYQNETKLHLSLVGYDFLYFGLYGCPIISIKRIYTSTVFVNKIITQQSKYTFQGHNMFKAQASYAFENLFLWRFSKSIPFSFF